MAAVSAIKWLLEFLEVALGLALFAAAVYFAMPV